MESSLSKETLSLFIKAIMNGGSVSISEEEPANLHYFEALVSNGFLRCDEEYLSKGEKKQGTPLPVKAKRTFDNHHEDEYAMMLYSQFQPLESTSMAKRIKMTLSPTLHVNWDLFKFRFQSRWLVGFFTARIHSSAGAIMKIILEKLETNIPSLTSTRITLFDILQNLPPDASLIKVGSNPSGLVNSSILSNITTLVLLMIDSSMDILHKYKDESELSIGLNLNALKRASQALLCEKYVQDRFGDDSFKIFRLLGAKQLLEEKQISKLAMLSLKDVRERLFQLHKCGFISIQVSHSF